MELVTNVIKKEVTDIPKCYSKELNTLVKKMLDKDPNKRPNCKEILLENFIVDTI